jgi:hypothetical protein
MRSTEWIATHVYHQDTFTTKCHPSGVSAKSVAKTFEEIEAFTTKSKDGLVIVENLNCFVGYGIEEPRDAHHAAMGRFIDLLTKENSPRICAFVMETEPSVPIHERHQKLLGTFAAVHAFSE